MQFFFLAMVQNSEVVKKAHDQLDKAIGHDHLPTVKDRAELPYIEAVVKEVLRWQPVVPLGELSNSFLIEWGAESLHSGASLYH